jgi:hypothetical protein
MLIAPTAESLRIPMPFDGAECYIESIGVSGSFVKAKIAGSIRVSANPATEKRPRMIVEKSRPWLFQRCSAKLTVRFDLVRP